jgi:two-component system chemotaxis response regulator CheB
MSKRFGPPSGLTCPDCGGALWEVKEGRVLRYQCHVGHQYAPDALDHEQSDAVDGALWSAVRVLEEQAELKSRMAQRADSNGLAAVADGFNEGAREAREQALEIRAVLSAAARRPDTRAARPTRQQKTHRGRRTMRKR